jgi:bifunctional ADP-heptose synthase (sugar kinase/adenylyltransferase)
VQRQADRAAVLEALSMVDAVVVFDEDTPVEALGALRPHLFVKGGDYAGVELPERAAMARWGGEAVTVPFVEGYSTTRLVDEASRAS